jgi:hypothetical protein
MIANTYHSMNNTSRADNQQLHIKMQEDIVKRPLLSFCYLRFSRLEPTMCVGVPQALFQPHVPGQ